MIENRLLDREDKLLQNMFKINILNRCKLFLRRKGQIIQVFGMRIMFKFPINVQLINLNNNSISLSLKIKSFKRAIVYINQKLNRTSTMIK